MLILKTLRYYLTNITSKDIILLLIQENPPVEDHVPKEENDGHKITDFPKVGTLQYSSIPAVKLLFKRLLSL